MLHAGDDVQAIPRLEADLAFPTVGLQIHLHGAAEELNGFVFDAVILITQRFSFVDVKNLTDVTFGVGPDELMAPGLRNDLSFAEQIRHDLEVV